MIELTVFEYVSILILVLSYGVLLGAMLEGWLAERRKVRR